MWYNQKRAIKCSKRAQLWIFTPHFSDLRAFRTLQSPKRHVFWSFLQRKKHFSKRALHVGTVCNKWLKKALMIVIEKGIQSFIQFIPFNTVFQVFSQYSITGRWDNSYYDLVLNLFYGNYLCSFEYQWKNTNQEKKG